MSWNSRGTFSSLPSPSPNLTMLGLKSRPEIIFHPPSHHPAATLVAATAAAAATAAVVVHFPLLETVKAVDVEANN